MLMSFECTHCNYQNNEVQNAGKIEEKGIKIKLSINSKLDLNRQVVKSDYTSVCIPYLDFEIPSQSQKGGKPYSANKILYF
jgi:zinc finger protein